MAKETGEIVRLEDFFEGRRASGKVHVDNLIVVPGHNPRDFSLRKNLEHVERLKVSILSIGLLEPVLVRFDAGTKTAYIVDGESRYRAVKAAVAEGHSGYIDVIRTSEKIVSEELATIQALEANTGKHITQWEVGSPYAKFRKWGWSDDRIATQFQKSARYVRDAIELSEAPSDIKQALDNEEITVAVALKNLRNKGNQASASVAAAVASAKAQGKTKVVAQYTKRAQVTKVDNEFLVRLHKALSGFDFTGSTEVLELIEELEVLLPGPGKNGQAAKDLDSF